MLEAGRKLKCPCWEFPCTWKIVELVGPWWPLTLIEGCGLAFHTQIHRGPTFRTLALFEHNKLNLKVHRIQLLVIEKSCPMKDPEWAVGWG